MRNTLFALSLLTLVACSGGASSEQRIALAKGYIDESDYHAAIIELQDTLQRDDASAEARWLLGLAYLETGEVVEAENQLQRAQALGWKADDILPALAKALLAQGKNAEVITLDPQGLDSAAAAQLLSAQGVAHSLQGEFDAAHELVDLALRKEPRSLDAKLAEATIALQHGDSSGALVMIEAILEAEPDNGEAWWLKAHALIQSRELEAARAAVDKSIVLLNHSVEAYLTRALINLQLKDYAAAKADSEELIRLGPRNPSGQYVKGLLNYQDNDYRGAITALTLAKPIAKRFPTILFYLSRAHLADKDLDLAASYANQFVALAPDDSNGRKLLAAILVQQKKAREAQQILQAVLDHNPDDVGALNIMANALLLDDQADIGIALYVRITQLQPDWRIVPLRLESGLVGSDSGDAPMQPTASAPDNMANFPQNDILLIMNNLAKKDFQGAIDAANSYQFRDLEGIAPCRVLGMVYLAAGQPSDARDAFEKALKRKEGDVLANLSLAQMALQAGDPDKARQYYQTALNGHPDDLTALLQLSALEAHQKNEAAMVARLQQAITAHPAALEPRLKLAGYYLASGSPNKIDHLFASLGKLQRKSARVLELTALAQLAQQQNDSALATAQELVNANPESAQYHFLLAKAVSETGDTQKAKQVLMDAIKRDPEYVPALINLAGITQRQGAGEEFEQYLATLVKLAPEDPEVLRLRALSAKANGNDDEALGLLQRAFKDAPGTQAVLQLSALQQATGNNEAARKLLQQWISEHPSDVAVRLALAFALELGDDLAGAKAQYLAVLELNPGNVNALNNLAWNLKLENPEMALDYIRRATAIAPDQPDLLDTLAIIEHLGGDNASAHRSIQRALALSPGNFTMRFHLAMIEAALGEKEHAIATLEQLVVKDDGKFPERAEAEKLLETLRG